MNTYFFIDEDGDKYEVNGDSVVDALLSFDIEHGAASEMLAKVLAKFDSIEDQIKIFNEMSGACPIARIYLGTEII